MKENLLICSKIICIHVYKGVERITRLVIKTDTGTTSLQT